ncbi:MAG: S8 family serine peptidase, partial [Gemmatimonadales bacterium]
MRNPVRPPSWLVSSLLAIAAVAGTGCNKETNPAELSAPAKLVLVSGDAQSVNGPVAAQLPLVVRVTDPKDRPVANVSVTWSASDPTASLSASTTTTDTAGKSQVTWTLGQAPGRQTVTATTARIAGAQAVFQAVNGVTTQLAIVSGDNQVGDVATALTAPLVVRATDVLGHPATGVNVSWSAVGGGVVTPTSQVTDAQGQASASWTLSPVPGPQSASAQSAGPPAIRAVFVAGTGASISGGVTVQAGLPIAFSTTSARRNTISKRTLGPAAAETRRLIVQFKPGAIGMSGHIASGASAVRASTDAMHRVLAAHQALGDVSLAELSPVLLAARVTVPAGTSVADAMAALRNDASIESVAPDDILPMLDSYVATPFEPPVVKSSAPSTSALAGAVAGLLPNDPLLFPELWHYNMVGAPRAWAKTTGSANVLVAVVDVGVRFDHPAVSANFTNDGYNFVTAGNRLTTAQPICGGAATTLLPEAGYGPDPTAPDDLEFTGTCWSRSTIGDHGLHVSGTIGAVGNDGVGTVGINWQVKIRPVRVLDITGSGSFFDIAQGVLYAAGLAASNGAGGTVTAPSRAAIINMSLGGYGTSTVLANAVAAASNAGSLIIASAGNDETNFQAIPASYPSVVAVSALGPDLQLAGYTNVGSNVSLAAPGGEFRTSGSAGVASTTWNYVTSSPGYAYYEGTSMAAPHVSGVAALVVAANPGLTNAQLRDRLQSTAVHLGGPGRDDRYGFGLVNAYNAVTNTTGPTRAAYVRIVNAVTGDAVRTVAVRSDG